MEECYWSYSLQFQNSNLQLQNRIYGKCYILSTWSLSWGSHVTKIRLEAFVTILQILKLIFFLPVAWRMGRWPRASTRGRHENWLCIDLAPGLHHMGGIKIDLALFFARHCQVSTRIWGHPPLSARPKEWNSNRFLYPAKHWDILFVKSKKCGKLLWKPLLFKLCKIFRDDGWRIFYSSEMFDAPPILEPFVCVCVCV